MLPAAPIGDWTLDRLMGVGGCAEVWTAERADGALGVLKVLRPHRNHNKAEMLRREIEFLLSETPHPGLMPVIDVDRSSPRPRWYAMPLAVPLQERVSRPDRSGPHVALVIDAFTAYAATMADLHCRGFGHSDLKPANLYRLEDRWVIGDMGFVSGPGYPRTPELHWRGRRHRFVADELRQRPLTAPVHPADVFSLARCMFALLTEWQTPEGHPSIPGQTPPPAAASMAHPSAIALEPHLRRAMSTDADERPTMPELHRLLHSVNEWSRS